MKKLLCAAALLALPASAPGQIVSFPARGDLVVFSATAVDGTGELPDAVSNSFAIGVSAEVPPITPSRRSRAYSSSSTRVPT